MKFIALFVQAEQAGGNSGLYYFELVLYLTRKSS